MTATPVLQTPASTSESHNHGSQKLAFLQNQNEHFLTPISELYNEGSTSMRRRRPYHPEYGG